MERKNRRGSKPPRKAINWKAVLLNVLAAGLALVVFFLLLQQALLSYTFHGQSITVPDFQGKTIDEVQQIVDTKQLRFEIRDSTFNPAYPRLSVVDQNPKALSKVKQDRTIYLTINAAETPRVPMPDIIDASHRQAVRILQSYGLEEGTTEYKPDPALNAVLEIKIGGRTIRPGDLVEKGATVDLVLGDGGKSNRRPVPNLVGKPYDEAVMIIMAYQLTLGPIVTMGEVRDTARAKVFKQYPLPEPGATISPGESIDLWITE